MNLTETLNRSRTLPGAVASDIRRALAHVPDVQERLVDVALVLKDEDRWEAYLESLEQLDESIQKVADGFWPQDSPFGDASEAIYRRVMALSQSVWTLYKGPHDRGRDFSGIRQRTKDVLCKVTDVLDGMALAFEATSAINR